MRTTSKRRDSHGRRGRPESGSDDGTLAQVLEDYATAYRLLDAGKLAAYAGKYVGIVNGAVVGAAADAAALRNRISSERGIHAERIAVIHVFDEALAQG